MKAALFDLDGVIVDTENQYTAFWSEMQRLYLPDNVDFALQIKGQSLTCILKEYFLGENVRREVLRRLEAFEATMSYLYINGARAFVESLKAAGVPTAIVTSSNKAKMEQLYKAIPDSSIFLRLRIFVSPSRRPTATLLLPAGLEYVPRIVWCSRTALMVLRPDGSPAPLS